MKNYLKFILFPCALYGMYFLGSTIYHGYLYYSALLGRAELYEFLQDYYQVILYGPAGSGKTLLLSVLASMPHLKFKSYTNFPHYSENVDDTMGGNDLTMNNNLRSNSWLFLDEVGLYGDGTDPKSERKNNPDTSLFLQFVRHCGHHLFISTQRLGGGIGNEMRDRSALFIKLTGFKKFGTINLLTFQISDNQENLNPSFGRIPITNSDYQMYDSYGMRPAKERSKTNETT